MNSCLLIPSFLSSSLHLPLFYLVLVSLLLCPLSLPLSPSPSPGLYHLHGAPGGAVGVRGPGVRECAARRVGGPSGSVWTPVPPPVSGHHVQQRQQGWKVQLVLHRHSSYTRFVFVRDTGSHIVYRFINGMSCIVLIHELKVSCVMLNKWPVLRNF